MKTSPTALFKAKSILLCFQSLLGFFDARIRIQARLGTYGCSNRLLDLMLDRLQLAENFVEFNSVHVKFKPQKLPIHKFSHPA